MNESNSFGYQEEQHGLPMPQPGQGMPNMAQHKFSPDELKVLQECNSESFYKRSMPFATFLSLGTFAAVQKGLLKPNPRFGAAPKMTLAVIVGYFMGKVSYQQECADKLMNLPGSYIGQLLRERKEGKVGTRTSNPVQPPSFYGVKPGDIYSDAGPGNSLDLDSERPIFSEDIFPHEDSSSQTPPEVPIAPRSGLSYDELRRKNRGEYSDTKQDPYKMDGAPPIMRSRHPLPPPPVSASTNKYGDTME